jgi:hypothetical protein
MDMLLQRPAISVDQGVPLAALDLLTRVIPVNAAVPADLITNHPRR